MSQTVLAKMAVVVSANIAEFAKGMKDVNSQLKGFTSTLSNVAGAVGLAFGVREVAQFVVETTRLAGQADAVRIAFERLPDSERLMTNLKNATHGTVSELELMKRAVMASNFDISLEALPRLLEFATLRAQQTGQSVDYLVDSIVTGIGRKSKLILDNLGISASQLSAELKGASTEASTVGEVAEAVGRIAEKNLKNMAGFAENAASKMDRLSASWENFKIALFTTSEGAGDGISFWNRLNGVLESMAGDDKARAFDKLYRSLFLFSSGLEDAKGNIIELVGSGKDLSTNVQELQNRFGLSADEAARFMKQLKPLIEAGKELRRNQEATGFTIDPITGVPIDAYGKIAGEIKKTTEVRITTIQSLEAEVKNLNGLMETTDIKNVTEIDRLKTLISQKQEQIKAVRGVSEEYNRAEIALQGYRKALGEIAVEEMKNKGSDSTAPGIGIRRGLIRNDLAIEKALPKPEELGVPFDVSKIKSVTDEYSGVGQSIMDKNSQISESFSMLAADVISSLAEGFGSGQDIGKSFLKGLSNFGKMFARQLVAIGVANLFVPGGRVLGLRQIAAGAALAVVSGAISANASSGSGGSGGASYNNSIGRGSVNSNVQTERRYVFEMKLKGKDAVAIIDTAMLDNRNRLG